MDFTISNENIYKETCQLCGVRFSRAGILAVHIEFVHNYLEKNMQQVSKLGYSSMTTVVENSEAQPTESKLSPGIVVKTEGIDQTVALSAVPLQESVTHSLSKMQQVSMLGYSSMDTAVETSEAQPTESSTSQGVVMKTQGDDHTMHLSAVPLPESVACSLSKMQQVSTRGYSSMTTVVESSEAQPKESGTSPGVVMKTQGSDQTMHLSAVPLPESVACSLSKIQHVPKLGYSIETTVVEHSEAQPRESTISPGIVLETEGVDQTVPLSAVPLPESVMRSLSKMQLPYLEKSEIGPDIGPEIGPGIGSKIGLEIGPEVCPEISQKSAQTSSIPVLRPMIISRRVDEILVSEKDDVQNTGVLFLLCHYGNTGCGVFKRGVQN